MGSLYRSSLQNLLLASGWLSWAKRLLKIGINVRESGVSFEETKALFTKRTNQDLQDTYNSQCRME